MVGVWRAANNTITPVDARLEVSCGRETRVDACLGLFMVPEASN